MRLIDADKIHRSRAKITEGSKSFYKEWFSASAIDNAPTVEAIPIEWFEWLLDTMGDGMYNLRAVIKDWERYKEDWGERE